jgi:HEPN domain-containing protein
MVVDGNMKGHHIRKLLRKHIPDGYEISSDNMRNFRERALKHYLEEKPIDVNSAEKLLKFQPLDANEAIVLPNTDLCRNKVRELMQQVLTLENQIDWYT